MSCKKHTYVSKKTLVGSNIQILEYHKIDISERIDVNKTSTSKECDICHYWFCNGCHNLMQKSMSFNDAAIVYVKRNAYRIHFWYMSKDNGI